MVAIQSPAAAPRQQSSTRRELYRERCQDDDGNRFVDIVWQNKPGLWTVSYSFEDGTPVHYEDECYCTMPSGKMLTRCPE